MVLRVLWVCQIGGSTKKLSSSHTEEISCQMASSFSKRCAGERYRRFSVSTISSKTSVNGMRSGLDLDHGCCCRNSCPAIQCCTAADLCTKLKSWAKGRQETSSIAAAVVSSPRKRMYWAVFSLPSRRWIRIVPSFWAIAAMNGTVQGMLLCSTPLYR